MSGRASRNKGAAAEREVAKIINEHLGTDLRRTPLSGGMVWAGDIRGWDGWHIEVKRQERLAIPAWLEQTESDCPEGDTPLLIFRQSHQPWRAVLRLTDLLQLIKDGENT